MGNASRRLRLTPAPGPVHPPPTDPTMFRTIMYQLLDPSRFVVFITGATSGFGAAAARRYVAAGGKVIATGRRQDRLEALQAELGAENCHIIALDVRDRDALEKAIADIPAPFDAVNIVLANAGLALGLEP